MAGLISVVGIPIDAAAISRVSAAFPNATVSLSTTGVDVIISGELTVEEENRLRGVLLDAVSPPPASTAVVNPDGTVTGPAGPTGPMGPTGPAGPAGPKGDPGPEGPAGARGPAGADSTVPGPAGPKGDKGDAGATGPAGADSTVPGPKGDKGDPGTPGTNGTNGSNGRGITSVARTAGTGAAGTTDTYTITYSDATTSTFQVVNGANGAPGTAPAPGAWQTPTFGTSVSATPPTGFSAARARLEGTDVVRLRGRLSITGTIAANATLLTLPTGLRPVASVALDSGTATAYGLLTITSAGVVSCSIALASGNSVVLDGLTFTTT